MPPEHQSRDYPKTATIRPPSSATSAPFTMAGVTKSDGVLTLQRAAGNRAVTQLLSGKPIVQRSPLTGAIPSTVEVNLPDFVAAARAAGPRAAQAIEGWLADAALVAAAPVIVAVAAAGSVLLYTRSLNGQRIGGVAENLGPTYRADDPVLADRCQ